MRRPFTDRHQRQPQQPGTRHGTAPPTTLEVTPDGRIRGLWDDALHLPALGPCVVRRVSYVEFSITQQCWCVHAARSGSWLRRLLHWLIGWPHGDVLHRAPAREPAMRWEREHFAPGRPGWKRLHGRQRH
jgi:hypothetical protein